MRRAAWLALLLAGCGGSNGPDGESAASDPVAAVRSALTEETNAILQRADSIDEILRPLPLLASADEAALRRYLNAQQLPRARSLGVPRPTTDQLSELRKEGRLVPLEQDTPLWVVGRLETSEALVTTDARAMLTELAERFQARLQELGLPPYRLEVSSALRTADEQAALRRVNPNAAAGVSTHEYGTTLDVLYSRFAAPASLEEWVGSDLPPWLREHLERVAELAVERIGGRRAHELKAILGYVLLEMQSEGKVMVTLERQQPVFHMTVARRYPEPEGS